jgi:hypothetical protein
VLDATLAAASDFGRRPVADELKTDGSFAVSRTSVHVGILIPIAGCVVLTDPRPTGIVVVAGAVWGLPVPFAEESGLDEPYGGPSTRPTAASTLPRGTSPPPLEKA